MNHVLKSAVALLSGCLPFSGAYAECSAQVAPVDNAVITDQGMMKVRFNVQSQGCKEDCTGQVNYRVVYLTTKGEPKTEEASVQWTAGDDQSTRVQATAYRDNCNNAGSGPCQLQKVEVLDVTCSQSSDEDKERIVRNDDEPALKSL